MSSDVTLFVSVSAFAYVTHIFFTPPKLDSGCTAVVASGEGVREPRSSSKPTVRLTWRGNWVIEKYR